MNTIRHITSLLLLLSALSVTGANPYDFKAGKLCYKINEDGISVTVTHELNAYPRYRNLAGIVDIPSQVTNNGNSYSVTQIGSNAFQGCSGITNLTIPESISSIGSFAFHKCSGIENIAVALDNPTYDSRSNCNAIIETSTNTLIFGCKNTIIPNSVTAIASYAFHSCSGLTSVEIPNSVQFIGDFAFYECTGLTNIDISDAVTSIGNEAFKNCSALTTISIGVSVTTIGVNAFADCSHLKNVIWNARNCHDLNLSSFPFPYFDCIIFGNKVERIPANLCYCQFTLSNVVIPNSVTSVGDSAFYYCSGLTSLEIPESVTTIGYQAFTNCSGLSSIIVASDNQIYDSRDNCNAIIETSSNTILFGCKNTVITNSVTSIGAYAFKGCSALTSLEIPNSVTSINKLAFSYCSGMKSVSIGKSVSFIGSGAFIECPDLCEIYCMANQPPTMGERKGSGNYSAFDNVLYQNCTLYVPKGCTETYTTADNWKNFKHIVEKDIDNPDVNGDYKVDVEDLNLLINSILNHYEVLSDVNGDGKVDIDDLNIVISYILNQ